jgi:uncharacterized repeat protein (TIGR03803 family)
MRTPCPASNVRPRFIGRSVTLLLIVIAGVVSAHAQLPKYTTLHSFSKSDGSIPNASPIQDENGNLYGTTYKGGGRNAGTVFKLDPSGNLTTLHEFGLGDGAGPNAALVRDVNGNLYGTTSGGGSRACAYGCGSIFRIDANGVFTSLHLFAGGTDGETPLGGLLLDQNGNLYGTTRYGGISGNGTIFKLQPDGSLITLYLFKAYPDGEQPFAGLVADAMGNMYGTTWAGGTAFNYGTIYKLDASGKETVLYRFRGAADGSSPNSGVILDDAGNLYGTTAGGGGSGGGFGPGVVYKLDSNGAYTVLHTFSDAGGVTSYAPLVRDGNGNLYGTTILGGLRNFGTVFRLEPSGRYRVLHNFLGGRDRGRNYSGLFRDNAGNLYGTTTRGGTDTVGTVFEISF